MTLTVAASTQNGKATKGMTISSEMTGWAQAMGIVVSKKSVEEVVAHLAISDLHRQAFGSVHGGVYCGLVETAASMGAWLVAHARGQSVVGLENSTSFIRATRAGSLRATATPITRGRQTQVWETTIRNADDQIVAIGRVRFLCSDAAFRRSPDEKRDTRALASFPERSDRADETHCFPADSG